MVLAAPDFLTPILIVIEWLSFLLALVLGLTAFIHCLTQRADAFPAIGTLPKPAWLAIIGIFTLLGYPGLGLGGTISLFGLVGIAASLIYLLDVRVGLRDIADGKGMW